MSPIEPSVMAGQYTGISFCNTCQGQPQASKQANKVNYLVGPVVDRVFVVNLLAQPSNHLGRCPERALLLLLLEHRVQDGVNPLLKDNVVLVNEAGLGGMTGVGSSLGATNDHAAHLCLFAVISQEAHAIGNDEVADAILPLETQLATAESKITNVRRRHALS